MLIGRRIACLRSVLDGASHYLTKAPSAGFSGGRILGSVSILRPPASRTLGFNTRPFTATSSNSSMSDDSPSGSNGPPKETPMFDGCDYKHWFIVVEPPPGNPSRDDLIDCYIKTLAQVVGSEEEARMKIYSVSTKHYFAFGCEISQELAQKLEPLPNVQWVLPHSYSDPRTKTYGGEPFINGQAVPYDPKYHEDAVRNNARSNQGRSVERRNFDRSRNFERRREMRQNAYRQQNVHQQQPPSRTCQADTGTESPPCNTNQEAALRQD